MEALERQTFSPFAAPTVVPVGRNLPYRQLFDQMSNNMLALYGPESFRCQNLMGRFLGRRSLLSNDPDVIRYSLIDHSEKFRRTDPTFRILRPILGHGLFLNEGEEWRHQRRTMAPAFAPRAMDIVARVTESVIAQVISGIAIGQPINLMRITQRIALNVAGQAMFSMPMDGNGDRLRRLFERYGTSVGRPFPLDMIMPPQWPSPTDFRRRQLGGQWLRAIQTMLDERAAMSAGAGAAKIQDLYALLSEARDPVTDEGFERQALRDQFATMIIAGHETTALTLLWAMILLAKTPVLQARIAAEASVLDMADRNAAGFAKWFPELKWTDAVIKETLRLYPPAFLIVREAKGPVRMGVRVLFRGDYLNIAPWVLHRHHDYWQDPDFFDPRRFFDGQPPRERYMPFGAGPRICIGMAFATTEAVLVLARFMQRFEIRLAENLTITPRAVVTTYPDPIPSFIVERRVTRVQAA